MSLLFHHGGCCCKRVPPTPPHPAPHFPILRLIRRIVIAALLFALGIFFIFNLFGFIPILILIGIILLLIGLLLFR